MTHKNICKFKFSYCSKMSKPNRPGDQKFPVRGSLAPSLANSWRWPRHDLIITVGVRYDMLVIKIGYFEQKENQR